MYIQSRYDIVAEEVPAAKVLRAPATKAELRRAGYSKKEIEAGCKMLKALGGIDPWDASGQGMQYGICRVLETAPGQTKAVTLAQYMTLNQEDKDTQLKRWGEAPAAQEGHSSMYRWVGIATDKKGKIVDTTVGWGNKVRTGEVCLALLGKSPDDPDDVIPFVDALYQKAHCRVQDTV